MKIRFMLILSAGIFTVLSVSIFTSYTSIQNHQKMLEKELLQISKVAGNNIEVQKRIALYKVFSEKMVVETTRKVWLVFFLDFILILIIFSIYIYGVRRPIILLSKKVNSLYFEKKPNELKIKEIGTEDVRTLIRAFNEMLEKLKQYEQTIANIQKYRGWKEISRVLVHEINNILSPIQTYVEYFMDNPEYLDKASLILGKLGEIREILNRLREFSHFPEPTLSKQNITSLISEVAKEFGNVNFNKAEEIFLYVDPLLFKEILRNLIKNALESADNVTVNIVIKKEKSYTTITVEDNGCGIPPQLIDKIFLPGFSTKKRSGNIGIGLSLVQSLVQEQGGSIQVESELNKGTKFYIKFPSVGE